MFFIKLNLIQILSLTTRRDVTTELHHYIGEIYLMQPLLHDKTTTQNK